MIVVGYAMSFACAQAQTASNADPSNAKTRHESKHIPGNAVELEPFPINIHRLSKPGLILGNGPRYLARHATTCDSFILDGETDPERSTVKGCIRGADRLAGPIQVRLLGVHNAVDSNAGDSGEFLFSRAAAGDYVLLATQAEKVLGVLPIRLPLRTSMVMDVAPRIPLGNLLYSEY